MILALLIAALFLVLFFAMLILFLIAAIHITLKGEFDNKEWINIEEDINDLN